MQNPTPNISQSSQKGGQLAPVANPASQFIYIRIHRDLVLPVPTDATSTPPSPHFPSHLYLIEGTFEDVRRFSGTTVDWIIKIAHLICEPRGTGQVYIHTTGTTSDWYNVDRAASWRQVAPGDVLLPGIYEFEPAIPILLSQISVRQSSRSATSLGAESSSSTFRRHLDLRDDACVVTRFRELLIASHLIPKRIGSDGAKSIVARFSGVEAALDIHRFHPKIGILLINALNAFVDSYELGFYHVTGDTYALHDFGINSPGRSILGYPLSGVLSNTTVPRVHNFRTTLSVHGGDAPLPPKGVFDWHYLQCVIKRFGTPGYKYYPNIQFFVYPYKLAGNDDDSSDEYPDDDEIEPLYPSYCFDRFLAKQGERLRAREIREEVEQWSSGISFELEYLSNSH